MNRQPPDKDHDPGESQPLGPAIQPTPKSPDDEWFPIPGKPGLEVNRAGQLRYTPQQEQP